MMAGGAELEALEPRAAARDAGVGASPRRSSEACGASTTSNEHRDVRTRRRGRARRRRDRVRLDGPGARTCAPAPALSTSRTHRCDHGWSRWPTPSRPPGAGADGVRVRACLRRLAGRCSHATTSRSVSVCGPELRAPRDRGRGRAEAGKHVWVEKPAGRDLADTDGDRRGRARSPACSRRSASTIGNAPASRDGARARRVPGGSGGSRRFASVLLERLRRAPRRRAVVAVRPAVRRHRRARRPRVSHGLDLAAYVLGERRRDHRAGRPTRRRSSPSGPSRPASCRTSRRRAGGKRGPVGNEDQVSALLPLRRRAPVA